MPLIAWAVIAFAGGLLAGFGKMWTASLLAVALLAWLSTRQILPSATLLYYVTGFLLALASPEPAHFGAASVRADTSSFAERSRLRAARNIDSAFGADAPLAKALLVADQSEIPRAVKDRYADAGIIHMLSISGMHVTIIAGSVALMLHAFRMSVRTASLGAVAVVLIYVYILGFPPPAVRSAVMVCVVGGCRACQRHTSKWAVLALGAVIPLAAPQTVLDLGFQLSVGGMAALIAAGSLARRSRISGWKGRRGTISRALLASAVATLVTGPLVASAFGRLSVIAPITNLAADPVLALAQPMLFLALILAPWPMGARFVAAAVHPLLALFDGIATVGARVPYAAIAVAPSPAMASLAGIAAVAVVIACVSRFPARATLVASGAICAAIWLT